jgi:hypothetical protein
VIWFSLQCKVFLKLDGILILSAEYVEDCTAKDFPETRKFHNQAKFKKNKAHQQAIADQSQRRPAEQATRTLGIILGRHILQTCGLIIHVK